MRNMKVASKLISGFMVLAILLVIVGAVGILGISTLRDNGNRLYESNAKSIIYIGNIQINLEKQRIYAREAIFTAYAGQPLNDIQSDFDKADSEMRQLFADYEKTIEDERDEGDYLTARDIYLNEYVKQSEQIMALCEARDSSAARALLTGAMRVTVDNMVKGFEDAADRNETQALNRDTENASTAQKMTWLQVGIMLLAVIVAVVLGLYNASIIGKPLVKLKDIMTEVGVSGNLIFTEETKTSFRAAAQYKDEIGQLTGAFCMMMDRFLASSLTMSQIAERDLTMDVTVASEQDTMGAALKNTVDNLNGMFSEISAASIQVSTGSKQVADGSQALAQGSTEQAAAVEQLSASISEIAEKTRENAGQAGRAASLGNTIKGSAEKGSAQMNHMMQAVREINEASQSIGKVIGVIDNIAFQTNILALNAAVEAARAGQHGKGFAVVAEEVRSLASKSADAAKETASMIANSIEKAELGSRIAQETASSLSEIVSGINESSRIVGEIAKSSEEQALAIAQINKGIEQVAQVVQQNSATAEESAAASEEMSGQSALMNDLVSQFRLKNQPALAATTRGGRSRRLEMPERASYAPPSHEYENDYGKY